ncbi:hypothetical protein [Amycolatopsis speibonae]|uniref:Uncharacterized protein n=1 Tax=Amycolatopsis speibonae TaxID=1450224 RepID=A0ABV7P4P0_9PSEU
MNQTERRLRTRLAAASERMEELRSSFKDGKPGGKECDAWARGVVGIHRRRVRHGLLQDGAERVVGCSGLGGDVVTELIEAANFHQTRRHYGTQMISTVAGMRGIALCSGQVKTDVFTQEYHDHLAQQHRFERVENSSLPLCKRCERKAAKEGMEVPK